MGNDEKRQPHPMQPIYLDESGSPRFQENGIIKRIVTERMVSLSEIPMWVARYPGITQDDVDQFWQLIGYSLEGYAELAGSDVISEEAVDRAAKAAEDQGLLYGA